MFKDNAKGNNIDAAMENIGRLKRTLKRDSSQEHKSRCPLSLVDKFRAEEMDVDLEEQKIIDFVKKSENGALLLKYSSSSGWKYLYIPSTWDHIYPKHLKFFRSFLELKEKKEANQEASSSSTLSISNSANLNIVIPDEVNYKNIPWLDRYSSMAYILSFSNRRDFQIRLPLVMHPYFLKTRIGSHLFG